MSYRLGFDIGGTFTDLALINSQGGQVKIYKVLTTPDDPARGALSGIAEFLEREGISHDLLETIVHATTFVANIIIEHKGALVGLITTQGFRDVIEMRTEQRYDIYDLFLRYPPALSPRYLRMGVTERVNRDGRILREIDPDEIRQTVRYLKEQGVEAIAVCFLHSFRNPANEKRVLELIRQEWPDVPVSLSSAVAPEIREYERTSTTVANAYVQPILAKYLRRLQANLIASGFGGAFFPMLSSGSVSPLSAAIEQPIRLAESGPAAGSIAASRYGSLAGYPDLLAFDMGGTTAKMTLIFGGRPSIAPNLEVARVQRFSKGSGYPIQSPTVEMLEIGSGGGSIAWIDSMGLMKVGPKSAAANPGPACYGFGGQDPTVTDADLILGYLNPDYFLGGKMRLDVAAAQTAISQVAEALDLDVIGAASGIHRTVNESMASAGRIHMLEKARDPRKFVLMCFGGAGPVHAAGVAKILGSPEVIVPPTAGVASAVGLLIAPIAFDFVRSYPVGLDDADWGVLEEVFREMEARGLELLREAGVPERDVTIERRVDGRFKGQLHEIEVSLPNDLSKLAPAHFEASFHAKYQLLYLQLPSKSTIDLLTWRVTVSGQRSAISFERRPASGSSAKPARKGERPAYFPDAGGFTDTPVYDRYRLEPGMHLPGPAIVEERESTVIILPGMNGRIDEYLNLHLRTRSEA